MPSAAFLAEMARLQGSRPLTKIEHISKTGTVTDISTYFLSGGSMETIKERAPDEIQAGQFDIRLANHDDKFSEYKPTSLFYNTDYHGNRIRISQGFILPSGSTEYEIQGVGYIDSMSSDPNDSSVTLRCRDILWRIMDQKLHVRPFEEVSWPGTTNLGNGVCSTVDTMPFASISQNWTLTCTLGGADGVATFSVVGSISGSIGTATSGTEFIAATQGIKFTIRAGSNVWILGDTFTFQTKKYPEWAGVNAGKIIWSILTGYNWDTDTQEAWSGFVFNFDHTKSSANLHLNYDSFVTAIANIEAVGVFSLHGFLPYNTDAIQCLQGILLLFLGSLYTGNDGRIKLSSYIPLFGSTLQTFSDSTKITSLSYARTIDEVINSVSVSYKAITDWPWSSEDIGLDGNFAQRDSTSISKYNELGVSFQVPWLTPNGLHVQDFAAKLLSKYGTPPLNIDFDTGMDALLNEIGERVNVIDSKSGISTVGEIAKVSKSFDQRPSEISLRVRRDAALDQAYGFIGSEINEGDGLSPQSNDYDTSSATDKLFSYVGSSSTSTPDYRVF